MWFSEFERRLQLVQIEAIQFATWCSTASRRERTTALENLFVDGHAVETFQCHQRLQLMMQMPGLLFGTFQ
jgi:putative hemolysin